MAGRGPGARRGLRRAIKGAAAASDLLRRPPRGIVVLIYHRVGGESGLEIDLDPARFEAQIAHLADRVVTLDQAIDLLDGPAPDSPDPVVITFDDGTADFAEHALPVLVAHSVPATLYVATDFVESGRPFPDDGQPITWSALADAVSTGMVTVGSHTHTHALLDRLDPNSIDDELDRSLGLIEDRLGTTASHFAYPKAVPGSAPARAAVARRFRSAALSGTRVNAYGRSDPLQLARSPIQVSDGMRWFEHKARGGMGLEDVLRTRLNRLRYADARN